MPGVEADVVVIASCRKKRSLAAIALCEFEAKNVAIELDGPFEIANLQMNMADACAGIDGFHET